MTQEYYQIPEGYQNNISQQYIHATGVADVESYQTLSEIDHVLLRYDMYIGAIDPVPRVGKCFDLATKKIVRKKILHPIGQEQIYIEIIANAADNVQESRDHNIDPGQIEIAVNDQWVTVRNYGRNIPIAKNEMGVWIPESIFGNLRSSSKFDDTKVRLFVGKNGVGAKATCIFSKAFIVECTDAQRKLKYRQIWTKNMKEKTQPQIEHYDGLGYTQISYSPDFERFGATQFDNEAIEIYGTHAATVSFTCGIPVIFNGIPLKINSIIDYAKLFFNVNKDSAITYKEPKGLYELCLVDTPDQAVCASFVNGMVTTEGGVHMDATYKVVVNAIKKFLGDHMDGIRITKTDVVNHVSIFLNCRLPNPEYGGQTKSCLTRPNVKIVLPKTLLNKIKDWEFYQNLYNDIQNRQLAKLKKTDPKSRNKRIVAKEYSHAEYAGTDQWENATLLVIEGKSAAGYAMDFLSMVNDNMGPYFFGFLALHGKLLNSLKAKFSQLIAYKDFNALKTTLGMQELVDYTKPENYKKLNYGRVLYIPDSDSDGKHIMGLFLLFFMSRFSTLVDIGYIKFLRTPTIRVWYKNQVLTFYTPQSYQKWTNQMESAGENVQTYRHKYYKGLATSTSEDVKDDYIQKKVITFRKDPQAIEKILLAFQKEHEDKRKEWIVNFVDREILDVETYTELPISVFLDHEFIEYGIDNVIRAIPEAMDCLKESQRKVMFAAIKKLSKGKKKEIKVNQVASHAAEITAYKHGEINLSKAIVTMSFNFVGTNNMPYFQGEGQFGTRNMAGEDAGATRYTHIKMPWWTNYIYRKEDNLIYKYVRDEGEKQEYENFFPILHMGLINGVRGIGTGWSSNIPPHKPLDIALWLTQRLKQNLSIKSLDQNNSGLTLSGLTLEQAREKYVLPRLIPWYKGFLGDVVMNVKENGFSTEGIMNVQGKTIIITELPIGRSYAGYEAELEKFKEAKLITNFKKLCCKEYVKFIITGHNFPGGPTLKKLKLVSTFKYNNMTVLYRNNDPIRSVRPVIYRNVNELLEAFFNIRLAKYEERKGVQIAHIQKVIEEIKMKAAFIIAVNNHQIEIRNRPTKDVYTDMIRLGITDTTILKKVTAIQFTEEKVIELNNEVVTKQLELNKLKELLCEVIWYQEIDEFVKEYCKQEKVPYVQIEEHMKITESSFTSALNRLPNMYDSEDDESKLELNMVEDQLMSLGNTRQVNLFDDNLDNDENNCTNE